VGSPPPSLQCGAVKSLQQPKIGRSNTSLHGHHSHKHIASAASLKGEGEGIQFVALCSFTIRWHCILDLWMTMKGHDIMTCYLKKIVGCFLLCSINNFEKKCSIRHFWGFFFMFNQRKLTIWKEQICCLVTSAGLWIYNHARKGSQILLQTKTHIVIAISKAANWQRPTC